MTLKAKLPRKGNWLFSSFEKCKKHFYENAAEEDLDAKFESTDAALAEFSTIADAGARKHLLECVQREFDEAISSVPAVRDKAKQVLGSSSILLALITASVALVQNWRTELGSGWMVVLLAVIVWIFLHFKRALVLSICAITRDEIVKVSTQDVAKILSEKTFSDGEAHLALAAQLRSAVTKTNQCVLRRVNQVILAQTSFRWGLSLLSLLLVLFLVAVALS